MTETTEPTTEDLQDEERNERRQAIIQPLIAAITQREKFLLADRLGRPYSEIMEDPDRVLLALAWKKQKTENNGAAPNFDDLLDLTDAEVLAILGLDSLDDDQEAEAAEAAGKD